MLKSILISSITMLLFACNNTSNQTTTHADTIEHTPHAARHDQADPIRATMSQMMMQMHHVKPTGNNDIDFAAMMLEHHKGAVEMSKVEIDKGSNKELKDFAQQVINDQSKEISFMQDFIAKAPKTSSANSKDFQQALEQSMMTMMSDTTMNYHNIDKDFAAQMIPHHQSAVDMAQAYLKFGQEKSLRSLCNNIVSSQVKEIGWLKLWLANNNK